MFRRESDFQAEVRRRVDQLVRGTALRQRDCPQMYEKTAILSAGFATSYVLLVFVADA